MKKTVSEMSRYIDADAFIEDIKTEAMNLYLDGMKGTPRPRDELYAIIDRIEEQPTADVVEVRHGRWEKRTFVGYGGEIKHGYHCSECNTTWDEPTNHCPNCGAKMAGKE